MYESHKKIVLVCGGRDFVNYNWLANTLEAYITHGKIEIVKLIHGGARGADRMAGRWAKEMQIPVEVFSANWKAYGKSAGYIRNQQMLDEGKPDLVIAFPGGRGTANMIEQAHNYKIAVDEIKDDMA